MGRNQQPAIQPTGKIQQFPNVFLVDQSAVASVQHDLIFNNGTVPYFEFKIMQGFQYVVVDNRGPGTVRVSYNHPSLVMNVPINGAKTLSSGESLYFEEEIWAISIHYDAASVVEIIGKSNTQGQN